MLPRNMHGTHICSGIAADVNLDTRHHKEISYDVVFGTGAGGQGG